MDNSAFLLLEDGRVFHGERIGAVGICSGELVFNTSHTGYQEILSDPSYTQQIVTFTHPHIGNVGVNTADLEAVKPWVSGLVVRDMVAHYSNYRAEHSLKDWLIENRIVGISQIDTRALTHILREEGAKKACICADPSMTPDSAMQYLNKSPSLLGLDLVKVVTTNSPYEFNEPSWGKEKPSSMRYRVVVLDFGVKLNILRLLVDAGCALTVLPASATADEIMSYEPDGVFLSNGPGDPAACEYAIETVKALMRTNLPLFGICLGHQMIALASGADTQKMKFGHHGANHPVKEMATGRVFITSQNHGFTVDQKSLPVDLEVTHVSLFDGTVQGFKHQHKPVAGFQGHPEASPGPKDVTGYFETFIEAMTQYQLNAQSDVAEPATR